jgi:RTX calcium-binding nonapeptide repeat (4 copies)/Calx-beta domain
MAFPYNEAVTGDLSDIFNAPTALGALSPGNNLITGETDSGGGARDRDYFSFEVPAGSTATAIFLSSYTTNGTGNSYFALDSALFPDPGGSPNESDFLVSALIDSDQVGLPGTDLLTFGNVAGSPAGPGPGSLGPGTYYIWYQEGPNDETTYTFNIVSTANPVSLAIAATDASKLEGNAGNTPFTFTVTRSGDNSAVTTANWAVTGTGANPANAADFGGTLPTGTVSFGVGETAKAITVNVSGDTVGELNENFAVTLSNPSAPATISTATAAGNILNDDKGLAITPTNASQTEGNSGIKAFTFTIDRVGDTSGITDMKWTVKGNGADPANAADFDSGILPVGKVRFLPGETSKLISVNVRGDTTFEPDETFSVAITAVTGGSTPINIGTGTIQNDDAAMLMSRAAAIRNNVILGTAGSDTLFGTDGNDILLGVDPLNGAGNSEVDILTGGEGSDRFVLADSNNTYYLGNGISDYALITDFDATDTIQTRIGSALTIGGILPAGILGTALYLNTDLVAVVQGAVPTTASLVAV